MGPRSIFGFDRWFVLAFYLNCGVACRRPRARGAFGDAEQRETAAASLAGAHRRDQARFSQSPHYPHRGALERELRGFPKRGERGEHRKPWAIVPPQDGWAAGAVTVLFQLSALVSIDGKSLTDITYEIGPGFVLSGMAAITVGLLARRACHSG